MNTNDCKRVIAKALQENGLPAYKLSAKSVCFADLARCSCVFVKIHGWQPCNKWDILKTVARVNGFCIE